VCGAEAKRDSDAIVATESPALSPRESPIPEPSLAEASTGAETARFLSHAHTQDVELCGASDDLLATDRNNRHDHSLRQTKIPPQICGQVGLSQNMWDAKLDGPSTLAAMLLPAGRLQTPFVTRASAFYDSVKLRRGVEGMDGFFDMYRLVRQRRRVDYQSDALSPTETSPPSSKSQAIRSASPGEHPSSIETQPERNHEEKDVLEQPLPTEISRELRPDALRSHCLLSASAPALPLASRHVLAKPKSAPTRQAKRRTLSTPARESADAALIAVYTNRGCGSKRRSRQRPEWQ